jgi:phosphoribosyl 1,2-cyclic phosphate phosphodiesterase
MLKPMGADEHPQLRFLGASDSQGVPRWWCSCGVCEEARRTGRNTRTRPSVVIEEAERILIDAAPELRSQCSREGLRGFEAVLVTHAHNDHILGLGDIGDWALRNRQFCPIYAPAEVVPQLEQRFAYMFKPGSACARYTPLRTLEPSSTFGGYTLQAIRVPHGFNGSAYAFRFEREGKAWGYMPDCLGLRELEPWRGLELLILGASFYREDAPFESRSVYDVQEALELVRELKPKRTVLTHLGHGVDARKEAPAGACYAHDGLVISLP